MLADSQFPTRLTYNASIVYRRLRLRFGQVVPHDELCKIFYVGRETIREYIVQINRLPDVEVKNVRGVGYMMVEKNENA